MSEETQKIYCYPQHDNSAMWADLDTEFKEKQKLESRLDNIENMMSAIMNKLNT